MDTTGDSIMPLDEHGRIFGLINIVDLAVVLFIGVLVIAAGAYALTSTEESVEQSTTYATVELGNQSSNIASEINEGASYSPSQHSSLTVTDVYMAPQGKAVDVVLRVRLKGIQSGDSVIYNGAPPRLGRTLILQTDTYNVSGEIRAIGDGNSLSTTERTVTMRAELPESQAADVTSGRVFRSGDRRIATVEEVIKYETSTPETRVVYFESSVRTYSVDGIRYFGGTPLRRNAELTFSTDSGPITATVREVGGGLNTSTTEVLLANTITDVRAEAIDEGEQYVTGGRTIATVESKSVYGTLNPNKKRVYVGVSLRTVNDGELPRFGSAIVREGGRLALRGPDDTFTGEVRRLGATTQRGDPVKRTVDLQIHDAPPEMANSIRTGMSESNGRRTIARVIDVERRNASVILTSQDGEIYKREHPLNQDLTLTTVLSLRQTSTGTIFKGQFIQQGSRIQLDFGNITVEARVVSGYA